MTADLPRRIRVPIEEGLSDKYVNFSGLGFLSLSNTANMIMYYSANEVFATLYLFEDLADITHWLEEDKGGGSPVVVSYVPVKECPRCASNSLMKSYVQKSQRVNADFPVFWYCTNCALQLSLGETEKVKMHPHAEERAYWMTHVDEFSKDTYLMSLTDAQEDDIRELLSMGGFEVVDAKISRTDTGELREAWVRRNSGNYYHLLFTDRTLAK